MYKEVKFRPQNFGGYTLSLLLSGMFIGYMSIAWYYIIASAIIFFIAMHFYAKDNLENYKPFGRGNK
jgi:hypothetical protein